MRRTLCGWSVWMDSNHRPRAYQARALATWATDRYFTHGLFVRPSVLSLMGFEPTSQATLERLVSLDHRRQQFSLYGACAVNRKLVEMMGFEPMTPCLQGRCSPNWATPPYLNGNLSQTSFNRSLTTEQQTQSVLSEYTSLSGFCLIRLRDLKSVRRS